MIKRGTSHAVASVQAVCTASSLSSHSYAPLASLPIIIDVDDDDQGSSGCELYLSVHPNQFAGPRAACSQLTGPSGLYHLTETRMSKAAFAQDADAAFVLPLIFGCVDDKMDTG